MDGSVSPLEAKRLREAFKATESEAQIDGGIECDRVWVFGTDGSNNREQYLAVEKDGETVGYVRITNATLKRLKGEFIHWRQIGTGCVRPDYSKARKNYG